MADGRLQLQAKESIKRYKRKYKELYEDIILNYYRPIKKSFYLCASRCCDNKKFVDIQYQECVTNCFIPTSEANYYIKSSFDDCKRRFKTCKEKCDEGRGFNSASEDDEGTDNGVTKEELEEVSFPEPPGPEYLMDTYLEEFNNVDLEHEVTGNENKEAVEDVTDGAVCSRLCAESYGRALDVMVMDIRKDLAMAAIRRHEAQMLYYVWSRSQTARME